MDDIGRNQRSRIRELILLDALARETRPYSRSIPLERLGAKGFSGYVRRRRVAAAQASGSSGSITSPPAACNEITLDGLGHQRKLRASFGALVS